METGDSEYILIIGNYGKLLQLNYFVFEMVQTVIPIYMCILHALNISCALRALMN